MASPCAAPLWGPEAVASSCAMIFPSLEDSHVVNVELLRKDSVVDSFLAAPGAADSRVQDQVVRFVEGPDVIARPFVLEGEILFVIKEKVDPILVPSIR